MLFKQWEMELEVGDRLKIWTVSKISMRGLRGAIYSVPEKLYHTTFPVLNKWQPVDTRRFNFDTTSVRCWNDGVCLSGSIIKKKLVIC